MKKTAQNAIDRVRLVDINSMSTWILKALAVVAILLISQMLADATGQTLNRSGLAIAQNRIFFYGAQVTVYASVTVTALKAWLS